MVPIQVRLGGTNYGQAVAFPGAGGIGIWVAMTLPKARPHRGFAAIALAVLMSPLHAHASIGEPSEGFTYFHKLGASIAQHDAQIDGCSREAIKALRPFVLNIGPGGLVTDAIHGYFSDQVASVNFAANIENCMVVRGWEVARLPDAEGQALAKQPTATQSQALASLVGAPLDPSRVVRRYSRLKLDEFRTAGLSSKWPTSLSLSATKDRWGVLRPEPKTPKTAPWRNLKPGKAEGFSPTPGKSYFVVLASTVAPSQSWLTFVQNDGAKDASGGTAFVVSTPTKLGWKVGSRFERASVFEAPPGRWKLASVVSTSLCLSSAEVVLAPGEVVYLGGFSATDPFAVDLDKERVRSVLPSSTYESMRTADYAVGASFDCSVLGATLIYGLPLDWVSAKPQ